jgi:SAM-dependent methyltransferase
MTTLPDTARPPAAGHAAPPPRHQQVTRAQLYTMMRAYKQTSLLRAGVNLGVFDALDDAVLGADQLAARIGADGRGSRILLDALAAIGLVQKTAEGYSLDQGARELLVASSPAYYGGMTAVVASDDEWEAMRRLGEAVRAGGTVMDTHAETPGYEYWETFASSVSPVMSPASRVLAEVVGKWADNREPWEGIDALDVACGHGLHGMAVLDRVPEAHMVGLDWENVLPLRRKHAEARGLGERVSDLVGDMFEVDLQGPYDLILVTNVLHHFSEERAAELLRRVRDSLRPGGRVGIVGFTIGDGAPIDDPEPHLFSVLMLTWTHEGEVHSVAGYERILTAAGLTMTDSADVPDLPFHVLLAARSEDL